MDPTWLLLKRLAESVSAFSEECAKQAADACSLPMCEVSCGVYGLACVVIDYNIMLDDELWADVQAYLDSDDYYKPEALELRQQQKKLRNKDGAA